MIPSVSESSSGELHNAFVEHIERAVEQGFIGDPDAGIHLDNARAYAEAIPARATVLDLGSGGGVPGIALLTLRPDLDVTMLDSQRRRCELLRTTIDRWPIPATARVVEGRAEDLARSEELTERFDIVVARLFGAPAVTAECAVRFLRPANGALLVSEPPAVDAGVAVDAPGDTDRWPAAGLRQLGLDDTGLFAPVTGATGGRARIRVIRRRWDLPDRYPRPTGRPAKRPLF